ncbi:unnamed protein product, partial [Prorocentrum cordatum]
LLEDGTGGGQDPTFKHPDEQNQKEVDWLMKHGGGTVENLPSLPVEYEWIKDANESGDAWIAVRKKMPKATIDAIRQATVKLQDALYTRQPDVIRDHVKLAIELNRAGEGPSNKAIHQAEEYAGKLEEHEKERAAEREREENELKEELEDRVGREAVPRRELVCALGLGEAPKQQPAARVAAPALGNAQDGQWQPQADRLWSPRADEQKQPNGVVPCAREKSGQWQLREGQRQPSADAAGSCEKGAARAVAVSVREGARARDGADGQWPPCEGMVAACAKQAAACVAGPRESRCPQATGSNMMSKTPQALTTDTFRDILNEQLDPIRKDILAIKEHGVSQHDLQAAINPLKDEIDGLTKRIGLLESHFCKDSVKYRHGGAQ